MLCVWVIVSCFVYEWLCHALCMNDCVMLCVWVIVSCFVYEWLCHALCMSDCVMLCVWVIVSCFVSEWLCYALCMSDCVMLCVWVIVLCFVFLLLLLLLRWTSGFKLSSCGNEPRTLSPRAYTTLTSCWFLYRYSFVLKKRLDLVTRMKMVWQNPDILKQSFFRSTRPKKHRTKTKKENMPKNSEDRLTALGKKKNSDLSETKFQKKKKFKKDLKNRQWSFASRSWVHETAPDSFLPTSMTSQPS